MGKVLVFFSIVLLCWFLATEATETSDLFSFDKTGKPVPKTLQEQISSKPEWLFKVVIPHYRTPQFLQKGLESLKNQTYPYFDVVVMDDDSGEPFTSAFLQLEQEYKNSLDIKMVLSHEHGGAIFTLLKIIELANVNDEDVLVFLDGDDWLYDSDVLSTLYEVYTGPKHEIWLTYGSFVSSDYMLACCLCEDRSSVIEHNSWRSTPWLYSHLKTAKYHLFKKIHKEDLMYDGQYFDSMWDRAIMFPMLEMAGERSKCISKPLYFYNVDNDYSWFKTWEQVDIQLNQSEICARLPSYLPLTDKSDEAKKAHNNNTLINKKGDEHDEIITE